MGWNLKYKRNRMKFDSLIFMFGSIMEWNQKYCLTFLYKFYILTPPSSLISLPFHRTSIPSTFFGEIFFWNFFFEKFFFWKICFSKTNFPTNNFQKKFRKDFKKIFKQNFPKKNRNFFLQKKFLKKILNGEIICWWIKLLLFF